MSDYERIAKAIAFINERVHLQPSLEDIAAHLNLSPFHFQRLFSRWAGVTPKKYLQILTVERAKKLLQENRPLLEVSDETGLSSGSRLYDHFIQLEAITPGEHGQGGKGVTIEYGVHSSPFGVVFLAATQRGICRLSFISPEEQEVELQALVKKWPNVELNENQDLIAGMVDSVFAVDGHIDRPLSLCVSGTNFQVNVWRALLQIPSGTLLSYNQVARLVGKPRSARAVGLAVGANPIAFLIPCHRVIRQSGELGGYRWGVTRKHAIHAWESARLGN